MQQHNAKQNPLPSGMGSIKIRLLILALVVALGGALVPSVGLVSPEPAEAITTSHWSVIGDNWPTAIACTGYTSDGTYLWLAPSPYSQPIWRYDGASWQNWGCPTGYEGTYASGLASSGTTVYASYLSKLPAESYPWVWQSSTTSSSWSHVGASVPWASSASVQTLVYYAGTPVVKVVSGGYATIYRYTGGVWTSIRASAYVSASSPWVGKSGSMYLGGQSGVIYTYAGSGTTWTSLGTPSWYSYVYPSEWGGKPVVITYASSVVDVKQWSSGTTWTSLGCPVSDIADAAFVYGDGTDLHFGSGGRGHIWAYSGSGTSWVDEGTLCNAIQPSRAMRMVDMGGNLYVVEPQQGCTGRLQVAVSSGSCPAPPFPVGDGTPGNPYHITNVYELQSIEVDLDAHYVVDNDIDASASATWNSGKGFKPISYFDPIDYHNDIWFSGHLDGQGYSITGLTVNRPSGSDINPWGGLFLAVNGATIQNLEMIDPVITVYDSAGAIAGNDYGGCLYDNVTVTNPDIHTQMDGGGFLGMEMTGTYWSLVINAHSDMNDCHVVGGSITADSGAPGRIIGGMMGWWNEGEISGSDSSAEVIVAENDYGTAGGFIGWVDTDDTGLYGPTYIHDCFSTGGVAAPLDTFGLYGGFAGWIDGGTFTNCYATGDVNTPFTAEAGGFTSWSYADEITDCYATGDVYGIGELGGFVAWADDYGTPTTIHGCYATGDIYMTTSFAGDSYAGGFVACNNGATIEECFCTGGIFIDNTEAINLSTVGGFVGDNWYHDELSPAIIRNCYSRTNISVTAGPVDDAAYNGGFCGWNDPDGLIDKCYSTGSLGIGGTERGGFCGLNEGAITSSYWDTQTSGEATSDGGTGKSTSAMKTTSTFSGWAIGSIWYLWAYNDGYPCFVCPPVRQCLYETWGYVPSTRPAWYQAFPSILKLLYVACIFLAAIFVYRQKPKKPEYPDMMGPEV